MSNTQADTPRDSASLPCPDPFGVCGGQPLDAPDVFDSRGCDVCGYRADPPELRLVRMLAEERERIASLERQLEEEKLRPCRTCETAGVEVRRLKRQQEAKGLPKGPRGPGPDPPGRPSPIQDIERTPDTGEGSDSDGA